ncbi:MAG: bifunctional 2-C-methyl-D-erythritol 4-phosphate cytidylyltransferase/2-C-methyl-D-erythritol 2,4-cyclodiphosphate synthase [Rhabdaerophilum calidifontis]
MSADSMSAAMSPPAATAAIVVAAGRGARFGGEIPKQYRLLGRRTVLAETLARLGAVPGIGRIVTVIHPDDAARYAEAARLSGVAPERLAATPGAATRQASVAAGLAALAEAGFDAEGIVLIHDAARPLLSELVILRAILAARDAGAAMPVLRVPDTLAVLDAGGALAGHHDRGAARLVQTPQAFRFGLIRAAHARAAAGGRDDFTDDAGLAAAFGHPVVAFAGDPDLMKITEEADLARAARLLARPADETRSGIGYDVHAFTAGDHVMLGGVRIAHGRALSGHSDADPVLHALTDALLGTIGDGDIGQHFPPSDPRWRGADSRLFLADAARRVAEAGGRIVAVDCTIVCEAPKIGPHRAAMQAAIGAVLGLAAARVGVKATTSERLGFTGRGEGIAAIAIANVAF